MIVNINLRLWCDWPILRNRKDIARALLGHVKARDLATHKNVGDTVDEFKAALARGCFEPWRNQIGSFVYALTSYRHETSLVELLGTMQLLSGVPFEYTPSGEKVISEEDGETILRPVGEAHFMVSR